MILINGNTPWCVAPLDGKYYGTIVVDANGREMLRVWGSYHDADAEASAPSNREKGKWSAESWKEYCCDSHYEAVSDLKLAEDIVRLVNSSAINDGPIDNFEPEEALHEFGILLEWVQLHIERLEGIRTILSYKRHRISARRQLVRLKKLEEVLSVMANPLVDEDGSNQEEENIGGL